ncbi:HCLS1-associated protein X-1-like [Pseudonaja textilis]|uniref:HCLS1-associated protein X-1-like n=1 Tax=Pseudonaja textilis TaxID=8673 RepID=A0A670ZGZ5_PSETE|nr:HCLS1-associated protein X-1-like [Pseudonaja textilis]XP_026579795.1 HCLS1-associated protein X-1-like [Pseudonaja textilis]
MSVFDLFRGFFGFRRTPDPFWGNFTRDDEDDEDDEDDLDFQENQFFPDGFSFGFTFEPGGIHFHDQFGFQELFRDFNHFFNDIGTRSLPPPSFEFPRLECCPPPSAPPADKGQTLRNSMLKFPDSPRPSADERPNPPISGGRPWAPFQGFQESQSNDPDLKNSRKEDGDLDSQVTSRGLQAILPPAQSRSYFKSVSVTKVMAPDGTVEERRTVRDSQGHEETVVTRSLAPDGSLPRAPGDPAPFISGPEGDLSDTSSILNSFFRRWFPNQ